MSWFDDTQALEQPAVIVPADYLTSATCGCDELSGLVPRPCSVVLPCMSGLGVSVPRKDLLGLKDLGVQPVTTAA
jgi:hypothetical protein